MGKLKGVGRIGREALALGQRHPVEEWFRDPPRRGLELKEMPMTFRRLCLVAAVVAIVLQSGCCFRRCCGCVVSRPVFRAPVCCPDPCAPCVPCCP